MSNLQRLQLTKVIAILEKTAGYVARNGIVFEGLRLFPSESLTDHS
jgi:hypothetical protein